MSTELEARGLFNAALSRAQKAFPPIKKTRKASVKGTSKAGKPYEYDYTYADLADVLSAILPCLNAEEISVRQPIRRVEGRMYLVTELHHSSGHSVSDDGIPLGPNNDPQAFGGEQSYARRQGLCGLAGVAAEENEDAQVAKTTQQRGKDYAAAQQRTAAATKAAAQEDAVLITSEEQEHIKAELKRTERKAKQLYDFLSQQVGTPIPARRYKAILEWFKAPLMPEVVSKAFAILDFTPDEIAQFCTSKGNDWASIQTQLENMIGAKSE